MKFGAVECGAAGGGILAHAIAVDGRKWKKGRQLSAADCQALTAAGIAQVVVAMPQEGDLLEDDAAQRVAAVFRGANIRHGKPFTGRVNIFADSDGLLCYDAAAVHQLNAISPQITAATLPPYAPVAAGDMLATIKIIPFALAEALVSQCCTAPLAFAVQPFVHKRLGLIQTTRGNAADKTRKVTDARLAAFGARIISEARVAHTAAALTAAITQMLAEHAPEVLLIAGAQAVSDECDTVPAAVVAAGGVLRRVGMPVDPGNLLLLAQIGDTPVIGLPGCAKSPKLNGFDWVLSRTLAAVPFSAADIGRWGVGGLLAEASERPLPRQAPRQLTIAALLLAAGASSRMGGENKLLCRWRGQPLVAHAAKAIAEAQQQNLIKQVVAVTGRDGEAVAALLPPGFARAHNPHYGEGMASSLVCGINALAEGCDAVLIFLADMPRVQVADIAALVNALPVSDADIIVPQHRGKRGNPVLLRRRLFARLLQLQGDAGARTLFGEANVEAADAGSGVLHDVDTPAAFDDDAQ